MRDTNNAAIAAARANFERFKENHPEQIENAIRMARRSVNSARTRRKNAYAFAESMEPHLERARAELWEWPNAGSVRLAKWLNDNGIRRPDHGGFHQSTIDDKLYGVADIIAKEAVMECRTRMTARAMSADFERASGEAHALETFCITRIADALALSERLQGLTHRTSAEMLLIQARKMAAFIAREQRSSYFPMLARELYTLEDDINELIPDVFATEEI